MRERGRERGERERERARDAIKIMKVEATVYLDQ